MKRLHLSKIVFLLMVGLIFYSSPLEKSSAGEGSLQFGLEQVLEAASTRGSEMEEVLQEATAVLITVEDQSHNIVLNSDVLPLNNMNGFSITHPVALTTGTYNLTQFIILDSNSQPYLACPVKGSVHATYVNDPLPVQIIITRDTVTQIVPEVLYSAECTPEDTPTPTIEPPPPRDAGTFWIIPEKNTANNGSFFDVEIHFNSGTDLLGTWR